VIGEERFFVAELGALFFVKESGERKSGKNRPASIVPERGPVLGKSERARSRIRALRDDGFTLFRSS